MATTGWVKVVESDNGGLKLSFFETEKEARISSFRDTGQSLADNVKKFSFGLNESGLLTMDIT